MRLAMSGNPIFTDPQPRDLRVIHFQRAAMKTFGELRNLTHIHDADIFKSQPSTSTIATELTPRNPLLNPKFTFSSPIPSQTKGTTLPHGNVRVSSPDKPSEVSEFLRDRLALREKMDESTHSVTRRFLAGKKSNALERRYLSTSDIDANQNPIKDPYSRMIMFYKNLIFHFGQKRVDLIQKFFCTYKQALSVRFRILDMRNTGYISTEEMRDICSQFSNSNNKEFINEIIDFVEENDNIYYKCFLVTSASLPDKLLYGEDSRTKFDKPTRKNNNKILTTDEVIQHKRREYDRLIALFKSKNILLSKDKFERALLLPENRTLDDIVNNFTGISITQPSSKPGYQYGDRNSSDTESEVSEPNYIRPYLSTKPPTHKKVTLSTGRVTLRSKVDCWLSFKDYLKITTFGVSSLIDSKRYLANPNAFWTGSEDKLYPYLPNTKKSLQPTNVHFQRINRQFTVSGNNGSKHGTSSWPVNTAGYIQYGSIPDKQCAL